MFLQEQSFGCYKVNQWFDWHNPQFKHFIKSYQHPIKISRHTFINQQDPINLRQGPGAIVQDVPGQSGRQGICPVHICVGGQKEGGDVLIIGQNLLPKKISICGSIRRHPGNDFL